MKTIQVWFYGLLSGFIGGGATTASAWIGMGAAHAAGVDVPELNLKALGVIYLSGGITSALAYLKKSPLPQVIESTTQTQTVSVTNETTANPTSTKTP